MRQLIGTSTRQRAAAAGIFAAAALATALTAAPAPALAAIRTVANVTAAPSGYTAAARTLRYGMRGADVKRLQDRLAQLRYFPGPRDGHFGTATLEAVWAFQEVQRIPVTGQIGRRMDWRLAHPSAPRPLIRKGPALRVEVNLRHEVLYVYHHHRIVLISHVSSGGGYYYCSAGSCSHAVTPAGNFRTLWRVHGWHASSLGLLYNPVFFDGGFAIHGDTEVPLRPVSHGCVRIPMDVAAIFPGLVPREGIPVYVRR